MTRFVNPYRQDPFRVFASTLNTARFAMKNSYDAAYASFRRCTELLDEHRWSQIDTDDVFHQLGLDLDSSGHRGASKNQIELQRLYAQAYAEDLQGDYQAGIVLLFADDALQRLSKGLLGVAPGLGPKAYGPEYGAHLGKVKLTSLIRAGTNAIRHVSEWDDYPWSDRHPHVVYPKLADCKTSFERQAISNIEVFQKVLGLGISERIREPLSMRLLIQIDGKLAPDSPMQYERFEDAILLAARQIASEKNASALKSLEAELKAAK